MGISEELTRTRGGNAETRRERRDAKEMQSRKGNVKSQRKRKDTEGYNKLKVD
jgi:hypothetical protein